MKKFICILLSIIMIITLTSCGGMSISYKYINEISNCVLENIDTLVSEKETEFFEYKNSGLSIGAVYYGYYYTKNNEPLIPDFYGGTDLSGEYHAKGDGYYFGKPNNGTDWCYVEKITDNWFYYELHWA